MAMSDAAKPTLDDLTAMPQAESPRATISGTPQRDSFVFKLIVFVAVLGAATGLRALVGPFVPGVPFGFYYPAMIVIGLVCGWEFGTAAIVLGLALAWYFFVPPVMSFHWPNTSQSISLAAMAVVGAMLVAITAALRNALGRTQASEARYREMIDATSGIVTLSDHRGSIAEPQHGWTNITGMAWPEYKDLGWLKAVHPDDHAHVQGTRDLGGEAYQQRDVRVWSAADNNWRWFNMRAVPLKTKGGEWMSAFTDIHERKLSRERQEIVIGEHRHRLKNLITVIDSLANWSKPQGDEAVAAFLKKFSGRLRALGSVGDQVVAADWKALQADAVIRAGLAPFLEENSPRIVISGPSLSMNEQTAGSLALAMHELATNALKYGALSVKDGTVTVAWTRTPRDAEERVAIDWRERGGPPAVKPEREGFGLRLIRFVPAREREGEVVLDFTPKGFVCTIAYTQRRDTVH